MSTRSQKIVVVGSGIAGLTCALDLAELGHEVVVVTKSKTSDSATFYAQGGVASQWFSDIDDSVSSHVEDTLNAGAGLASRQSVETLVNESKNAIKKLLSRGAQFDRLADGTFARTIEGGHSVARIIHSHGDKTGEEVERALVDSLIAKSDLNISVVDFNLTNRLNISNKRCVGVSCVDKNSTQFDIEADHVVLATGGAGQLFSVTTNPLLATGDGIALALKNSVVCADLEFMQFHPTALHVDNMPRPLVSEALRGAGAVLRDIEGNAFMDGMHKLKDLAPRDVVSREIHKAIQRTESDCVYLDAKLISNFERRFPTIYNSCIEIGVDPTKELIPVSPAAHYYCGGIVTDINGATSLSGLWAAGEVADNGVHGANRLASNSLLDGLVFGSKVTKAIDQDLASNQNTNLFKYLDQYKVAPLDYDYELEGKNISDGSARSALQKLMNAKAGIVRDQENLESAFAELKDIVDFAKQPTDMEVSEFEQQEFMNLFSLSQAMISSAIARKESRGCHTRLDFKKSKDEYLGHFYQCGDNRAPVFVSNNEDKIKSN